MAALRYVGLAEAAMALSGDDHDGDVELDGPKFRVLNSRAARGSRSADIGEGRGTGG